MPRGVQRPHPHISLTESAIAPPPGARKCRPSNKNGLAFSHEDNPLLVGLVFSLASGLAARTPASRLARAAAAADSARSAHRRRRPLRRQSLQLHRHAEPAAAARHGLARRDDVDGCPRRDEGGQDDHHHLDRRHRAERAVARARQAQLRAAANCDAIARKLGNALCAPIVPFVPEGRSIRRAATC